MFHKVLVSFWPEIILKTCSPSAGESGTESRKRSRCDIFFPALGESVTNRRVLCVTHNSVESLEQRRRVGSRAIGGAGVSGVVPHRAPVYEERSRGHHPPDHSIGP